MGFQVLWTKTAETTFSQLEAQARAAFESRQRHTASRKSKVTHSKVKSRISKGFG